MAPLPADLKAYREQLLRLLVWPEGQRWATQVEGENEYPHRRGPLQAGERDLHLLGHQTEQMAPPWVAAAGAWRTAPKKTRIKKS